jgi:hypothetical protein
VISFGGIRETRKSDVIHIVNFHNRDALLLGAPSISETYIYMVESFKDYWEHLQPDRLYFFHKKDAFTARDYETFKSSVATFPSC